MNEGFRAVVRKEFREYRRNKMIVITMGVLPLVFVVLPLVPAIVLPADATTEAVVGVTGQAMLLLLAVPLMVPTTVAAYAVIGEREQGTLEPVLTTPLTARELLLGKCLAATVPAVLLTWALFGIYAVGVRLGAGPAVVARVWTAEFLASQLLLAPVLAVFAIAVGMAVSVRSTDIRVAQQLAGLAMLPAMGGVAAVAFGLVAPSVGLFAAAAAGLAVLDAGLWRVTVRLFDTERLLTRYGPT